VFGFSEVLTMSSSTRQFISRQDLTYYSVNQELTAKPSKFGPAVQGRSSNQESSGRFYNATSLNSVNLPIDYGASLRESTIWGFRWLVESPIRDRPIAVFGESHIKNLNVQGDSTLLAYWAMIFIEVKARAYMALTDFAMKKNPTAKRLSNRAYFINSEGTPPILGYTFNDAEIPLGDATNRLPYVTNVQTVYVDTEPDPDMGGFLCTLEILCNNQMILENVCPYIITCYTYPPPEFINGYEVAQIGEDTSLAGMKKATYPQQELQRYISVDTKYHTIGMTTTQYNIPYPSLSADEAANELLRNSYRGELEPPAYMDVLLDEIPIVQVGIVGAANNSIIGTQNAILGSPIFADFDITPYVSRQMKKDFLLTLSSIVPVPYPTGVGRLYPTNWNQGGDWVDPKGLAYQIPLSCFTDNVAFKETINPKLVVTYTPDTQKVKVLTQIPGWNIENIAAKAVLRTRFTDIVPVLQAPKSSGKMTLKLYSGL